MFALDIELNLITNLRGKGKKSTGMAPFAHLLLPQSGRDRHYIQIN